MSQYENVLLNFKYDEYEIDDDVEIEEVEFAEEEVDVEERVLFTDEEKEEMSVKYQPLVFSIVSLFTTGNSNDRMEVESAANFGLLKALNNYNKNFEKNGVLQFASFARRCIVNQIYTDVSKYASNMKRQTPLDSPVSNNDSGDSLMLKDIIPDKKIKSAQELCERQEIVADLKECMKNELSDIERFIICSTYGAFGYDILSQAQIAKSLVKIGAYKTISQAAISKQKKVIMSKLRCTLISKYKITHY